MHVRPARLDDREAVAAFTEDTWPDRDVEDYLADAFPRWIDRDGETARTFVVEAGDSLSAEAAGAGSGDVVAVGRANLLSAYEAWTQGFRVAPEVRGHGVATRLTRAAFAWAADRGATVCRNMVFSWNGPSLGLSRRAGFAPCTEFRWARPRPDPSAEPSLRTGEDPDAAWAFWTRSDAAAHLRGLTLDAEVPWAVSTLTRERLRAAADDGRLLTVCDGGTRAFALRCRTFERETDGTAVAWAEYAVGAWDDTEAAESLFEAVARDAASVGADEVRVLVPESVRWVSDVAASRAPISDDPDFVMAADLTDPELTDRGLSDEATTGR